MPAPRGSIFTVKLLSLSPLRAGRILAASSLAALTAAALCTAPLATAAPASASSLSSVGSSSGSSTDSSSAGEDYDFYMTPPSAVGYAPAGTLLRESTVGVGRSRILYSSTLEDGTPTYVSGAVLEPTGTWHGEGPAPTVVMAPGTRGLADHCAPTKGPGFRGQIAPLMSSMGINYELPYYAKFRARGMRLVLTDYIGLGTPGVHTYANRVEQAHAVLDAARAVVGDSGRPVALFGYSQGGGAAAAGAELAEAYAPELNLRATYAGAPPADLIAMLGGSPNLGPNLAYAIAGFSARDEGFATAVNGYLNSKGRYWLAENSRSCIIDSMLRWGATPLSSLTDTGMSMAEFIASDERVSSVLAQQKLGTVAPTGRVLVGSAPNDDIVNHDQAMQLASDWQKLGAAVETTEVAGSPFSSRVSGGHAAGLIAQFDPALDWLEQALLAG